eukprot:symbB.v1.2.008951.t1/scaffold554.1/size187895/5
MVPDVYSRDGLVMAGSRGTRWSLALLFASKEPSLPTVMSLTAMLGAFSKSQKCLGFDSWQQPTKIFLDSVLKLPVD